METVDNQIEKDAIYYDIDYALVPNPPEGFSGKLFQWTKLFKEQHPNAITLRELKELVEKEKIHRVSKKVKQKKDLKSDDRIETKILDNDKRFKKKEDGFYYWIIDGKVSNIKVNPDQVK
jgi:23S rRNA-/tRNA-specific pseudouridylate synthase